MTRTPQFPVSIRLTDDVIQKLDEIAGEIGLSRSKAILEAIDRYVQLPAADRAPQADSSIRAMTKVTQNLEARIKMLEHVVSDLTGEGVPVPEADPVDVEDIWPAGFVDLAVTAGSKAFRPVATEPEDHGW
jgi:predicted transcriptional regulator